MIRSMIFVYNAAVTRINTMRERGRKRLTFYVKTSLGRVSFALPFAAVAAVGKLTFWRGTF